MEKWNDACTRERGGTRDMMAVRESFEVYMLSLTSRVSSVVYNNPELMQTQTQPLNLLPDHGILLALSNNSGLR